MIRYIILAVIIVLGVIGVITMNIDAEKAAEAAANAPPAESVQDDDEIDELLIEESPITFSHTAVFYDSDISVELISGDPGANIYYTLDGSPPGASSQHYTEPIQIRAGSRVRATTIKAVAVNGMEASPVITRSYITGTGVWERFTPETFVFVLSADPHDLYDYYDGIAVEGFLRDDYIKNEWNGGAINPPAPANFNIRGRESERPVYIEVYDFLGNTLIHQAAGIRVAGGWSRANFQKSWRIIARREYGRGKFNFPFFEDVPDLDGRLITRFDRLTLRNGGNDRTEAALRDELISKLARQAGFRDTYSAAPAAVFLNGEYYGFAWLKEALNVGFLEQIYGGNRDNYQIIQRNERGNGWNNEPFAEDDWKYVYGLAEKGFESGGGFNDDALFEEFCSLVDIESLMLYYAIQIFVDNRDWPHNNFRTWRYYPDEDEITANRFLDGRWRFLMYDTEFGYGLYGSRGFNTNTLRDMLRVTEIPVRNERSLLLWAVLQRADMRERFANTMCDLIDGAFAHDNVLEVLEELGDMIEHELNYAINAHTTWQFDYEYKRRQIIQFSTGRGNAVTTAMGTVFEHADDTWMYRATLTGADGAQAWLNTRRVIGAGESVRTNYFSCYEVDLKAAPYLGFEFVSWEINGTHYYEPDIRVSASMANNNGNISIQLHVREMTEGLPFFISELDIGNGADRIILYNPNLTSLSTRNLYLSDNIENLQKWSISTIIVQPQESLVIVMSNNRSTDALMRPQTNFNLRAGETLYLSDAYGEIIARVRVPVTQEGEIIRRALNGTYYVAD
ncbi:MAG: CotH kinase family protein [Oscillospiraceae bacterium]|jgi:hypothetical protein|nr:CotH kinase family protein [Oscillospiraceae bacterium]